jgi:DNA-binding SARP family transcriptional activator
LAPLYHRALEAGIEVEHVQSMIRRYRFPPPDPATASDRWPWPVRIYTLGRFDLLYDGQPLRSSRKAQNKPLELIKLLCAFGGFSVHQNQVTDLLWPDAPDDAADQALNTTLHRLRTLLKHDQAIRLEDRRLSLDPHFVWVDALAFDRIAHHPERIDRNSLQAALNRYRGHFLEGESAAWALTFRERLKSRFLKLSECLGSLLEQEENWPDAIDC